MTDLYSWFPVLAPALFALGLALVPRREVGALRIVSLAGPALTLLICGFAWYDFDRSAGGFQFTTELLSVVAPTFDFGLGFDASNLPLVFVSAAIALTAVSLVDLYEPWSRLRLSLLLLTFCACNAAFLSTNLFWFFFFCELTTLPKFMLLLRWPEQGPWLTSMPARRAAIQVTAYVVFGAMAILAALGLLTAATDGALDLRSLAAATKDVSADTQTLLYALAAVGFGLWSGLWPLHGWAAPVYTTNRAPANMVFGGVTKSFGIFGLLRLGESVLPLGAERCGNTLMLLGCVNVLFAGWVCLRQTDWNRLLTYSSLSHAGFAFVALGVGTGPARAAVIMLLFAHGLTTALGFALSHELLRRTGSRDTRQLSGLATSQPGLSTGFCLLTISAAGMPGSATFVAELLTFAATWAQGTLAAHIATAVCVFGIVLTATYVFGALHATFFGRPEPGAPVTAVKRSRTTSVVVGVLVATSLAGGLFPRLLTDTFPNAELHAALPSLTDNRQ